MRWIQHLDLKNKLVLLATVSGTMALVMACAGFVWHDLRVLKSAQIEELRTKAEMLALTSTSIGSFDQPEIAKSLVAIFKSHGSIEAVGLFDRQGTPLAFHPQTSQRAGRLNFPDDHNSYRYTESGELELFHSIIEKGRETGVVYLKTNMQEFYEQVWSHAAMILMLTLCSLGVAVLFASMMQSLISQPILSLAEAAKKITTDNDYTIRVNTDAHDELGVLYGSFNQMVQKIESSQAELKHARDGMELRVEQRTEQLQQEIGQRETIQQELVRAKEAAEAASESKSRFLANMSHEIRTPLNGILGFTDYLLIHDHRLMESDRCEYLRTIKKSGEGLLVLINDILDLSKIEAGQMEFERVRFSPHGVIADVISFLRPKAREKHLRLEYRWEGVVPDTIQSDPSRFRQLLMNLIGNAIKFTESGSVDVVVRLDQTDEQLIVDVIDTGVGIPTETQGSLFNPFTQGDSSVTRRFGGTGLGLSICKSVAQGLDGSIQFKSDFGRGSTFTFSIATGSLSDISMSAQPLDDIVAEERPQSPMELLTNRRILVADDGETNRKLIQLLLSQTGAEIVLAENGLEAVMAARNLHFDLILMDMQMPVMDGYSATAQLRAEGFTRPIIALTAHAMRGDEQRCLRVGCSEYLTKPIRQEQLLASVQAAIDGVTDPEQLPLPSPIDSGIGPLVSELPIENRPFAELVCEFIEHAHHKFAEMQQASTTKSHSQMARLAHWMKGSGGMAGFPALTSQACELEEAAKLNDIDAIQSNLHKLESLIARLQSPSL